MYANFTFEGPENLKTFSCVKFGNPESKDPEVKIQSLTIICSERPDLVLPIPFTNDPKKSLFILKEGSQCRLKFTFTVSNNIVSGLKYTNVVWKTGVRGETNTFILMNLN